MSSSSDTPLRAALAEQGFVVLPGLFTGPALDELRAAAERTTALARSGGWPHIRTVGKQFPPWPSTAPAEGIWGVQHLLHPSLADAGVFARSYFAPAVLAAARDLLACADDDLVLELYNMLVRPGAAFELRWHRDDVSPDLAPDEEARRLDEPAWHAQWNLALDRKSTRLNSSHRTVSRMPSSA